MDFEETKQRIAGPIAYPTTPFRKRSHGLGTVDATTFRKQIRFLIDGGIGIIVPCGGTGEFFSLSLGEWQILVEAALMESEGDEVAIMPSVGGGITQAIEMAQAAQRLGCDIVQITFLDPMFGVTEDGIYEYNRRIADSVSIAIMPYRTATFPMSMKLAKRLCEEVRNVAAFKEESGDVEWFREFVLETSGSVATVCGGGEALAPYYLLAGAKAFTSGIANLIPRLSLELYRAAVAHKWEEVLGIQSMLRPLATMRSRPGKMIPVIKEGLKMMGLTDDAYSRPPIMVLDEREKRELRRVLEDLGVRVTGRVDRPVARTGSADRKRRHPPGENHV